MISENLRNFYKKIDPEVTDLEIAFVEACANMICPLSIHPDFAKLQPSGNTNVSAFTWEIKNSENKEGND